MNQEMKTIMITALVIAAVVFLGMCALNCTVQSNSEPVKQLVETRTLFTGQGFPDVQVIRDDKGKVTCYATGGGSAISCIPDQINKLP